MLGSILPGFRDLRTPLVTGYLYLVAVWLLAGESRILPHEPTNTFQARLQDLANELDRVTTFAAVSLAAYLVGSIFSTISIGTLDRLGWHGTTERRALFEVNRWLHSKIGTLVNKGASVQKLFNEQALPKDVLNDLRQARLDSDGRWEGIELAIDEVDPEEYDAARKHWVRDENETQAEAIAEVAINEIRFREFDALVTEIQQKQPALWNEYDRLRSEAELRFGIVPPLALIVFIAVFQWSPIALLLLLVPFVLVVQGLTLSGGARAKVWTSLASEFVDSPTVKQIQAVTA